MQRLHNVFGNDSCDCDCYCDDMHDTTLGVDSKVDALTLVYQFRNYRSMMVDSQKSDDDIVLYSVEQYRCTKTNQHFGCGGVMDHYYYLAAPWHAATSLYLNFDCID